MNAISHGEIIKDMPLVAFPTVQVSFVCFFLFTTQVILSQCHDLISSLLPLSNQEYHYIDHS